ncbi:MAG: ATP-grasp domain-containing protein [Blastocatellia bacterium]|nr:ATP-grasp domain-containing protein [Blastocatellia bacterium]
MMQRTVLVLAASVYQLDAIRTARRLGYRTVTVDNRPENPGHAMADASYTVDTTDRDGVLEVARRESIAGIVSPCTDVAVPTAAYVAEQLGLPGPPFKSTLITCSKSAFRGFLKAHKFACPETFDIDPTFEPEPGLFDRKWVVKPNRSSGSKGVVIVDSRASFDRALHSSLAFDPDRTGVLEEFIGGVDGTCEGFLRDGRIAFSLLLERVTAPAPHVATHGHRVPIRLSPVDRKRVLETIREVLRALDIVEGPFDCDFIVRPDDVVILEISPRLGGNSITPLVRASTGLDLTELTLRSACRDEVAIPADVEERPAGLVLLGTSRSGVLALDLDEVERLRLESWVVYLELDATPGTAVEAFIDGRKRVGEALLTGASREQVDERAAELLRRVNVRALEAHV